MRSAILLGAFVAAAGMCSLASANMIAIYDSNVGNTYNYTLRFTVDQPGEQLRTGNFITIYDVAPGGIIDSITAPAGFAQSMSFAGVTPAGLGPPAISDSPMLVNATFTYSGPTLNASTDFAGLTIVTLGDYTTIQPGKAASTTSYSVIGDQVSTNVTMVPAVIPEPASLGVLSAATLLLLRRRR